MEKQRDGYKRQVREIEVDGGTEHVNQDNHDLEEKLKHEKASAKADIEILRGSSALRI